MSAAANEKPGAGGARQGAGRPKGARNRAPRRTWSRLLNEIRTVADKHYTRKVLSEMAAQDRWRFMERVVIPFALKDQPGALAIAVGGEEKQLPLFDITGLDGGASEYSGNTYDAEAMRMVEAGVAAMGRDGNDQGAE